MFIGKKEIIRYLVKAIVLATVCFIVVCFLHGYPVTVKHLADKYDIRITDLKYYDKNGLLSEKELTSEESAGFLEKYEDLKLHQSVFRSIETSKRTENYIEICCRSHQFSGSLRLYENGVLDGICYIFFPTGKRQEQLYTELLQIIRAEE